MQKCGVLVNDGRCNNVLKLKKDIFSMRYFQYGMLLFPAGPGDDKSVYVSPIATEYIMAKPWFTLIRRLAKWLIERLVKQRNKLLIKRSSKRLIKRLAPPSVDSDGQEILRSNVYGISRDRNSTVDSPYATTVLQDYPYCTVDRRVIKLEAV